MTGVAVVSSGCRANGKRRKREVERQCQISLVTLLTATFKKSMAHCHLREEEPAIEISWPSEVHHIAHVTFDRFHGFLGLPIEFELQVPRQAPSASVNVFGISPESMQCGYDSKGNSVPTILLLMQERLCSQGGLKAEGIFRINPENGQEKEARQQLSKGILPDGIDVHCLASLIKAWFRELPEGVMDSLSPGQVLQCETEEDYSELVNLLPPTQNALFNWAIELMTDVVEEEKYNKMNVRNIAMVFAPNMTQLSDPLTSLIHAVQVMNLLKNLILKSLREREEQVTEIFWPSTCSPSSHESSEEDMSNESSTCEDEQMLNCYFEKNLEEKNGLWEDSTDDCCSITEELMKDIEECFLKQVEWKEDDFDNGENLVSCGEQATEFSVLNFEAEFNFSLSECNQDSPVITEELSSRALPVRDAVKMIERYEETEAEMNHETMERNEVHFGAFAVRDAVKMIELGKGIIAGSNQGITTIDGGINFGKSSAQDVDCK